MPLPLGGKKKLRNIPSNNAQKRCRFTNVFPVKNASYKSEAQILIQIYRCKSLHICLCLPLYKFSKNMLCFLCQHTITVDSTSPRQVLSHSTVLLCVFWPCLHYWETLHKSYVFNVNLNILWGTVSMVGPCYYCCRIFILHLSSHNDFCGRLKGNHTKNCSYAGEWQSQHYNNDNSQWHIWV